MKNNWTLNPLFQPRISQSVPLCRLYLVVTQFSQKNTKKGAFASTATTTDAAILEEEKESNTNTTLCIQIRRQ